MAGASPKAAVVARADMVPLNTIALLDASALRGGCKAARRGPVLRGSHGTDYAAARAHGASAVDQEKRTAEGGSGMTRLETAEQAIADLCDDRLTTPTETLRSLKVLRDDVEDRIWNIKLATGIGLWKPEK